LQHFLNETNTGIFLRFTQILQIYTRFCHKHFTVWLLRLVQTSLERVKAMLGLWQHEVFERYEKNRKNSGGALYKEKAAIFSVTIASSSTTKPRHATQKNAG
jgi:hypothetical protein